MKFQSLLFTMLVAVLGFGQVTYYINSSTGSDLNDGLTSGTPFKTFTKAYSMLPAVGQTGGNLMSNTIWATGVFDWSNVDETIDGSSNEGAMISKFCTIRGTNGAQNTIFQASSDANTSSQRVFKLDNVAVSFRNVTIRNGKDTNGGGIQSLGGFYMYDCIVTNNSTGSTGYGGGIDTYGMARIENTEISYNTAGYAGGGVMREFSSHWSASITPDHTNALILINCTINNNTVTASSGGFYGGGVYCPNGKASITNCTITKNTCTNAQNGGTHGIGVATGGEVRLMNSIVAGNFYNSNGGDLGPRDSNGGSILDMGGNIVGARGSHSNNYAMSVVNPTTWLDSPQSGIAIDGVFTLYNTSTTGTLNLSANPTNNGSLNGKTFSFSTSSIAINNGLTGTNTVPSSTQTVNVPNSDQRGVARSGSADVGAFEGQFVNWVGTTTNPLTASNWNPVTVPSATSQVVIQSSAAAYPSYTSAVSYSDLTIDATASVTLQSTGQLTLSGALTNNGTMTLESGATFVQGSSVGGSGTYNVKQTVTGAGGATATGRFWYMGVPLNNLTRGAAFGNDGADNRLWSWSESSQAWSTPIANATTLSPTTGYVFRTGATSTTLNFSGTSLYSADASISGLTNTTGSFDGCHLMSNPYTAYLDWEAVVAAAGTTNLSSTYCVRSFNTGSNTMVYDTYNANGDVAVNPSGVAMTRYIAPMQAFWIVVNPTTTGSISMTKSMLSHQSGAVGLKDITSFPAFARLNLVSGDFYDQVVVYTDVNATAEFDDYDSKKFFLPNKAQVYCPVGENKAVINALKQGKAQTSAPLTVELPSTQVYKFEMAESFVENGLVILEDKQEGIFQDMGVNPIYEFYGNSGVIADRFVLHFQLPNGTNNEGQAGVEDLTNGQIAVIANHDGGVTVALSADLTTSGDIQIFDGAGRLVAQKAITSAQTSLQLNNGMGVYFVRVQTPMKTEMKKVMVY